MKLPEPPRKPDRTVILRPVFRYSVSPTHGRAWIWLTGAALLVGVIVTFLVPKMV